jgi:hypothetical protein
MGDTIHAENLNRKLIFGCHGYCYFPYLHIRTPLLQSLIHRNNYLPSMREQDKFLSGVDSFVPFGSSVKMTNMVCYLAPSTTPTADSSMLIK